MDYGLAVLATLQTGGGEVALPPWYHEDEGIQSDDTLIAALDRVATKR